MTNDDLREQVRARYAAAATALVVDDGCCSSGCCAPESVEVDESFGASLYDADDRGALPAVVAEMFRLLRPGGRIGISDVVAEDSLSPADRAERGSYVGCIAGALSRAEYLTGLAAAGFVDASVTFTHEAAPGMHAAIVRA